MSRCEQYFSQLRHLSVIPNGKNSWKWVSDLVLKFYDDPTVNVFEIVIFLRQVWWSAGKREGFGRRREKNENEGKRRHRRSYELTYHHLYLGYSQLIIYSIYLFLLFYKKEHYFISYQMNKPNIYIFQSIIFIYLFIYFY